MKKLILLILIPLLLLVGCSSKAANNDGAAINITGKVVRADYTSKGIRYYFDGGAWVIQPKEYPGIELGNIYKVTYREGDNSIISIMLVQK